MDSARFSLDDPLLILDTYRFVSQSKRYRLHMAVFQAPTFPTEKLPDRAKRQRRI